MCCWNQFHWIESLTVCLCSFNRINICICIYRYTHLTKLIDIKLNRYWYLILSNANQIKSKSNLANILYIKTALCHLYIVKCETQQGSERDVELLGVSFRFKLFSIHHSMIQLFFVLQIQGAIILASIFQVVIGFSGIMGRGGKEQVWD